MSRGKSQGTKEAPVKKTRLPGEKIPFYSDINLSTKDSPMLYAAVVRNPYKPPYTPVVESITVDEGYRFICYKDVLGSNLVDTQNGTVYIFNPGTEAYYGEPLGLVVGPDESEVKRIASETFVQCCVTELGLSEITNVGSDDSGWISTEQKKTPEISREISDLLGFSNDAADFELHDESPAKDSMFLAERKLECGPCFEKSRRSKSYGIAAALSECSQVIEHAWTYSMEVSEYVEPSGAICSYSEADEMLTVYSPTLWPSNLKTALSMALNLHADQIRISKKKSMDRGSNSLWYNSIIACQVAVAAVCLKSCVKLVYTHNEQNGYMDSMNPVTIVHK
ncbi:MAG: molybdopterin cofactor-binding domain-containing protein, partial [Treponema sp.]|nr:molybdopterin cofactor-binding domain-containing protein [Treponema sp.]